MTHLDDGTLQSFLDDELPPSARAGVAEHLLGCGRCRGAQEALMRANALFSRSVSVLDVEPPAGQQDRPHRAGRRARSGTASFVRAAGLILALAAAASAAVPGSPVRAWIASSLDVSSPPEAVPPAPAAPTARPAAPAGISLPAGDRTIVVALTGLEETAILLEGSDGAMASVSAVGCDRDPLFRTGRDRIEVRDAVGGQLRIGLPVRTAARLEVDGRLYAEMRGGALRLHVPADTVDGALLWR